MLGKISIFTNYCPLYKEKSIIFAAFYGSNLGLEQNQCSEEKYRS